MADQHPITPPPELVQQWAAEYWGDPGYVISSGEKYIATQAARWGADQELDACCEWLDEIGPAEIRLCGNDLRIDRRPQPKSLGKTALVALETIEEDLMGGEEVHPNDLVAIRRALERLQELEGQGDD